MDPRGASGAPHQESDEAWVSVTYPGGVVLPSQGWKLHVSATEGSAEEVLQRILPVLFVEPTAFKVARSGERLAELNRGEGGPSQVGKFVTVYPVDDDQAVRLASTLDRATDGLRGPRVPSDRALRSRSIVHYRYGAFVDRRMQTPLGEVVGAVTDPGGCVEPDRRTPWYHSPTWVEDPFVAAGLVSPPPPVDLLVAGRYLTAGILSSTPEVSVRLVVDLEGGRRRVLKEARSCGAQARLRHEAAVLAELAAEPTVPASHDVFEEGESLFLVIDHVPGLTLEQRVRALAADGRHPSVEQIRDWATTIAEALARLHARGMGYGDLKSPHVLVTPEEELFLVDFESAWSASLGMGAAVIGTPGYVSPQRAQRAAPSICDDVHSLGALLYFMITGAEPSLAPNRHRLLDRPVEMLNPLAPAGLIDLIRRCLDPDPERRPASMEDVRQALESEVARPTGTWAGGPKSVPWTTLARQVAGRICDHAAQLKPDHFRRDVDGGAAGVVLALAQAAPELDDPTISKTLRTLAWTLASAPPLPGGPLPGLYVGEAGIGAALLRAGQALGDGGLTATATERGRLVASLPHVSPDLFNGTAGRLRFHLLLHEATGEQEHLDAAVAAGGHLAVAVEWPAPDEAEWPIPSGYEGASGMRYLGYAHGVAGIADALLDLYSASGDSRFLGLASAGGRRLATLAAPVLEDQSGLDWADTADGARGGAFWCHGAGGITRFLAHAAQLDLFLGASDLCLAGARAVAGTRNSGPGQCHGLAGNADVLVDVFRATGDPSHLDAARQLGRLLSAFAEEPDVLVPASPGAIHSDDLMNGWAGVLACLLRLAKPDRTPHVLAVPAVAGAELRAGGGGQMLPAPTSSPA